MQGYYVPGTVLRSLRGLILLITIVISIGQTRTRSTERLSCLPKGTQVVIDSTGI